MKVSGAPSEPFSAIRRRALAQAGAAVPGAAAARTDSVGFLGVSQAELTPAVQSALQTLLIEIEDLRGEVARLKARLAEAERLADRDALTPVLNRRAFLRELSRTAAYCQRYEVPASVVYFDLDGFKAVNDRYGHAAGDAALTTVADRLIANIRESDILGRMGGDEFALILVQSDQATATAKASALAAAVEREPFSYGDWTAPVRLSFGVREISADIDPEALLADADTAMFAAKRQRRAG